MLACHPSFVQLKVTLYIGSHRTKVSSSVLEQVLLHDIQRHHYHSFNYELLIQNHCFRGSGKTLVALTNTLFCPSCKCDMCGLYSNITYEFQGLCHFAFFLLSPSNSSVQRQELFHPSCSMISLEFRCANPGTYLSYPWMEWILRTSLNLWKAWTRSLVSSSAQSPLSLL